MNRKFCYQIFDGDPDKGVEKYFTKDWACGGLSDCEELVWDNHTEDDVSDFEMSFGKAKRFTSAYSKLNG